MSSHAKPRGGEGGASTARYARPRRTDATRVYSPKRACAVDPALHGRMWTTHAHESTTRAAKTATAARVGTRTPRAATESGTSSDRVSAPRSVVSVNATSIFFFWLALGAKTPRRTSRAPKKRAGANRVPKGKTRGKETGKKPETPETPGKPSREKRKKNLNEFEKRRGAETPKRKKNKAVIHAKWDR